MVGRRVKLTLPVVESGLYRILAGGMEVGSAERLWSGTPAVPRYEAALWPQPGVPLPGYPPAGRRLSRPTLRELGAELQRRVDTEGSWWSQ